MNQDDIMTHGLPSTRMYLPGWWVRAWESSLIRQTLETHELLPANLASVLPSMEIAVLNIWAHFLSEAQACMSEAEFSKHSEIRLSWDHCLKDFGQGLVREKLVSALETFGSLRLLANGSSGRNAVPLFAEERWVEDSNGGLSLNLTPNSMTRELILGFSDGHRDLLRRLEGIVCTNDILDNHGPLALYKPAWRDLSGAEQVIYLRLEKAMQWQPSLVHLEGVFGSQLDPLFEQVKLSNRSAAGTELSLLMERLRLLGKVSCKLADHGVLMRDQISFRYGFSDIQSAKQPLLIWQATPERLSSLEDQSFFGKAFQQEMKSNETRDLGRLWQSFSTHANLSGVNLDSMWQALSDIPGGIFRLNSTQVLQAHSLFFEWSIRRLCLSTFALPTSCQSLEILEHCHFQGDIRQNFRRFVAYAEKSGDVSRAIVEQNDLSYGANLHATGQTWFTVLRDAVLFDRSSIRVNSEKIGNLDTSKVASGSKKSQMTPLDQPLGVAVAQAVNPAQSKLIRIAHEELEKMFRSDLRAYEELKSSYLKSLEAAQRSLLQDFQRRMKPPMFEQQLKQRLVRFMVNHPGEWKSTRSMLQ